MHLGAPVSSNDTLEVSDRFHESRRLFVAASATVTPFVYSFIALAPLAPARGR